MHCVWRQQNTQMRKIGIHEVQPCTVLPEKRSEARSLPDAFLHLFGKVNILGTEDTECVPVTDYMYV